jgi:hypothetical protein
VKLNITRSPRRPLNYRTLYPNIAGKIELPKISGGFTAFMVDQFVDVELPQSDGRNPEPDGEEKVVDDLEQSIEPVAARGDNELLW